MKKEPGFDPMPTTPRRPHRLRAAALDSARHRSRAALDSDIYAGRWPPLTRMSTRAAQCTPLTRLPRRTAARARP